MAITHKAGKTAPRLIEDIQLYDPANPPGTSINLLASVPPVYPDKYDGPMDYISVDACYHNYVIKTNQSQLDQGKLSGSRVSAVCSKCRHHLQVVVNYTSSACSVDPMHIHHFVYTSGRQKGAWTTEEVLETGQTAETFHYTCSHPACHVTASLRLTSALFGSKFTELLTNPSLIKQRAAEALAAVPERPRVDDPLPISVTNPLPINVLDNLRLYLTNAVKDPERSKKAIKGGNKRFISSFGFNGDPCKELFFFLGFEYREADGSWVPPRPNPEAETPYQDAFCIFIDDAINELVVLINQRPASEKKMLQAVPLPPSCRDDLYFAMEASDYPKSKRVHEFEMPPAPFYEDLGAVEDMSSSLIVYCYHRQVATDANRAPRYLEALKAISTLRGGEDWEIIEQAVQTAYAEGLFTEEDVDKAYDYFGLARNDPTLDEEVIIGKFYAFLNSTTQEIETRRQLWIIGQKLGNERIKAASEDRVTTLEQAHVFLGVDASTPDEFITTMYTTKVTDSPACKDLAHRAVEIIAEARKSEGLMHFVKTGQAVEAEMDIGDAYRMLQIPDRTVDEDAILAAYTICVDDNPGQSFVYSQALGVIAKTLNSTALKKKAGLSDEPTQNLSEWPVGLQNIGNTCYLNSLLQFYFSIRPFRDMVLSLEKYQMDMNDVTALVEKKVGSRKVTGKEIERSMRFLRELRVLFREMISSPIASATPSHELARLTLISPGNEDFIRRQSASMKSLPHGLGEINGSQISGPLGPPVAETDKEPSEASSVQANYDTDDVGSDRTLAMEEQERENQQGPSAQDNDGDSAMPDSTDPGTPPPVPPRNIPDPDREKQLKEELEISAQQDVTEVINNVLFQSQCAIKPYGFDEDGEQLDQIKDWFYGITRSYIRVGQNIRSKMERWSDIKVDVAGGPRDIYAALDGAFDAQDISVENGTAEQYGAIAKLPPILQIQVQRVQFDHATKRSYKSTNHLQLLETIYLDRYMDTNKSDMIERRKLSWERKKQLSVLEARRAELQAPRVGSKALLLPPHGKTLSCDLPSLFRGAKASIDTLDPSFELGRPGSTQMMEASDENSGATSGSQGFGVDIHLSDDIDQISNATLKEFPVLDEEIADLKAKIATQFENYKRMPYSLYAVFVHRGSVSFGHYWIYIFDFKKEIWRKYNDEYVTEVTNPGDIFNESHDTSPPTPYFLVYINSAMKERLVDPVFRDIAQPSTSDDARGTMEGLISTNPPDYDLMDLSESQAAPSEPLVSVSEAGNQKESSQSL
ncbi:Peptidase C19 ubiquitin carboxyl-terminal hydrolase 2 [Penicillium chermesinum]|uniref:ubiquitinyl hydrolase 1 n=1 Tax=Penicillium chermesinum TaxID=63820 RepID=A0A9W9TPB0_9EURO|nr:Peptidase C19 ubiquitin carboxyl-terminal hydrolase 2 [Penicillium chermesinum]KAJ5232089.1 Peptidase C19 ubiquitin carboxyl-terminal hydrolase 2 [Penicillium chermesinum]